MKADATSVRQAILNMGEGETITFPMDGGPARNTLQNYASTLGFYWNRKYQVNVDNAARVFKIYREK